ncbi:hypothetical protein, partial [Parabacteroides leei]|uniref:hypothetical protein n=1 Tax=Parabacteroides leei TaxID=2939491 RepID=UPI0032426892
MLNFCTLFDSVYLSRGLAMYNSLNQHCKDFHLYIFAFNDKCYSILKSLRLVNATVISLSEFEDEELLKVKPTRTQAEYCWTCSSSTILYVLNNYKVDHCTYLDSDLYFYSSPQVLIDEMGENSVLITPHRYTLEYDQSEKTGIYCVQFVSFKNNQQGRIVLEWWRNACLDWCYNRFEDGRFGDQKYLDDWPERFEGIYVSQNLGGGVAPWNMQQYEFEQQGDSIMGLELKTNKRFNVIFFHFHSFVFVSPNYFSPRPYYERNETSIKLLFKPYVKEIKQIRSNFPTIQTSELYLHGFKYYKYLLELLVRRGLKEKKYIKLLHAV